MMDSDCFRFVFISLQDNFPSLWCGFPCFFYFFNYWGKRGDGFLEML